MGFLGGEGEGGDAGAVGKLTWLLGLQLGDLRGWVCGGKRFRRGWTETGWRRSGVSGNVLGVVHQFGVGDRSSLFVGREGGCGRGEDLLPRLGEEGQCGSYRLVETGGCVSEGEDPLVVGLVGGYCGRRGGLAEVGLVGGFLEGERKGYGGGDFESGRRRR